MQVYRDGSGKEVRELRLPEEVFDTESMKSFGLLPVTNNHPPTLLSSANAKQYTVGAVGQPRRQDGWMVASMLIHDASAIESISHGRVQLSNGYSCELAPPDPSMTAKYGHHDAIQRNIRGNHLALVDQARAGNEARLRLDSTDAVSSSEFVGNDNEVIGFSKVENKRMATLKLDGMTFEVVDGNLQALVDRALAAERTKFESEKSRAEAAEKALSDVLEDKTKADAEQPVTCRDCDGGKLATDKKCDTCAGTGSYPKKMDTAERLERYIERRILVGTAKRADLVAAGRRILGTNEKLENLTDLEIKKRMLGKLSPSAKLDGQSVDYINARYVRLIALEWWRWRPRFRMRKRAGLIFRITIPPMPGSE